MRGKAKELPPRQCYLGITPAYAGKSGALQCKSLPAWDHPRVCGEKLALLIVPPSRLGSPPRMRGKGPSSGSTMQIPRITPAYAGKSNCLQLRITEAMGSPPRMRGKVCGQVFVNYGTGITPAYAGKRTSADRAHLPGRDHPRVCGEKCYLLILRGRREGSPPRMRGKELAVVPIAVQLGITPAYAGKRKTRNGAHGTPRDHPRVCGEKTKKIPSHRPFQLHPVPVSFSFA